MKITPSYIRALEPGQVFVFGSNLAGLHGAGAALTAFKKFGAIYYQGTGPMGQSYALPTKDENLRTLPVLSISHYVPGHATGAGDICDCNPSVPERQAQDVYHGMRAHFT